ncbi:hypothetical protein AAC387_Pa05g3286 [Persea americana]
MRSRQIPLLYLTTEEGHEMETFLIMLANGCTDYAILVDQTVGFEVYEKLLEESTEKKTVVLESIGDMAMFLGMNSSMLIMAGQFPGLEENCIYFTDDLCGPHYLNRLPNGCTDMGIFNLEDKTIRPLFLKRFHPPFSPPTWITPLL